MSEHPSRRSFLRSAAAVPALAVPGLVAASEMPKDDPRQIIDSYNAFLHFERRELLWEASGREVTAFKKLMAWVPGDNAGFSFHYSPATSAVERASIVLRAIGCDWTS
jgi:hypothetical protein